MQDARKTKAELVGEITELRRRIAALEEEKKAIADEETSLRENDALYRALVEASPDPIMIFSTAGDILGANARAAEVYGADSVEELLGEVKSAFHLLTDDGKALAAENIRQMMVDGYSLKSEYLVRIKNGTFIPVEISSYAVKTPMGAPWAYISIIRDITARKAAEADLRESEGKFRDLAEKSLVGIYLIQDHTFKYVNAQCAALFDYEIDEMIDRVGVVDVVHPEDLPMVMESLRKRLDGILKSDHYELRIRTGKGALKNAAVYSSSTTYRGRPAVVGSLVDITENKRTEQALRESEEKYRLLADNATDVIWTMDMEGRFLYVSPSIEDIFGYTTEEAMAMSLDRMLAEDDVPWVMAAIHEELLKPEGRRDERRLVEVKQYKKDGSLLDVEVSTSWLHDERGIIVGFQGCTRDISLRKQMESERAMLEKQLLQARKMEAIGTLAGGIAHDFNNILMGIQGHASLMQIDLAPDHPHRSRIGEIEKQIARGADLTRQLLGFARGGKYEIRTVNPNSLIDKTSELFRRTNREVTVVKKLQPDVWMMEADPAQIEQTLLNVFINAGQAMPGGGTLSLETRNVVLNGDEAVRHGATAGRYVKIVVADTGTGMDEETRNRIFDPFFSTKETGKGTGLGLASAYGIVKNHDGFIAVASEIGKGSTFGIHFPASDRANFGKGARARGTNGNGHGTVLLVDDESSYIEVTRELLENIGYRVLTAGSGREAVAIYSEKMRAIDVVILDMIMPGMGGGMTFETLREMDPDVKVILASGYSLNGEAKDILSRGCRGFIQKPFHIGELSAKIRDIM